MTPDEPIEDLPPEPIEQVPDQTTPNKVRAAIVGTLVIVALPFLYLLFHHAETPTPGPARVVPATPSIASLEAVVHANPSVSNRINLSLAYINGGRPIAAIPVLETVIGTDPGNLIAWNNLCVAHTMQQDYKPALEACQRAVQIDPAYQLAKNNLKWAQDENQKAVQSIATMEQIAPTERDAKSYIAEGFAFLHIGNNDEAIRVWKHALQVDPQNATAANNIGDAYMLKGRPADALAWFQKASAMDSTLQIANNNAAWAGSELAKKK